jgi:prolyl-tRNA synthetase
VPIWRKDAEKSAVMEFTGKVREALKGRVRLHVDDRDQYSPGWKYNEYELRGVPVRLEIGPRDVANAAVMSVRRDTRAKESIPLAALGERLPALLEEIQRSLFESAKAFRDANTTPVRTLADIEAHFASKRGFVALPWDGDAALEARIKESTGATLRCVPLDQAPFAAHGGGRRVALFARAY